MNRSVGALANAATTLRMLGLMLLMLAASAVQAQTSTSTTLSSSANPVTYGQAVTLTATVTGASPSGTVNFLDGGTLVGSGTLSTGGVATLSVNTFAAGSHSLTAVYAGDTNNAGSTSAALSQTVDKLATSANLTSSLNPSTYPQNVTLTATVTGSSPTGSITFKDGAATLGSSTLAGGVATFSTTALVAGSHSLTAVYAGDANHLTSTSGAVTQTVNQKATTTTLSVSQASLTQGQNLTLTASVNGANPSGLVTFTDGGATLGTASVAGGVATFSTSALALGSHSLAASYAGDANNTASSAVAVSVTVNARSGVVWQYGYDAMGRINTQVDPNGLATYFYYDSLGRRIQSQQPPNTGATSPTVIDYGYNLADALVSVTDPRSLTTSYTPNGLGHVTAQSSPDSGGTQYTYDAKGNVLTKTDARGKTTTYTYDALDRATSISYSTGAPTTFEYDGGTTPTPAATGELTRMNDESGQTSYSYDALGRMTGKSVTIAGRTFTVGYSWGDSGSALDKLTAITYPSGSRVNYSYDPYGSISGITVNPANPNGQGTSGTATTLLSGITYNAENKVTGWLWPDGKMRPIGYDSYGQIASYSLGDPQGTGNAAGVLRTLQRDAAGRITGYGHTNGAAAVTSLDQSFGYDSLNRLTAATQASGSTSYSYDATGNRTAKTIAGSTYANTISATSNRLTQVQDVLGAASVVHDAAGNVTSDGSASFAYSDRGRMGSATTAGGTVAYLYNGLGQRAQKSGPTALVASGASYFVYDEAGQLLGEYDANGNPVYETVYLGSMPVGALKQSGNAANGDIATTVYNVYADHIDTPRLITRQDHTIVWRWDTAEAFGATAANQDPSGLGAFVYNQRFPGQVFDSETGLLQNWNREYNPRWGRYVQSDPIGLEGGINTFSYVEGNPLQFIDPMGLMGGSGSGAAQRRSPAFSVFGCLVGCATYGTHDTSTQYSAELTVGGGMEICDPPPPPPPPPQMCSKNDGVAQVQPPGIPVPKKLGGAFIGIGFKSGGRFCLRIGPHATVPFTPSFDGASTPRQR
ncbi:Ig-like domain repeat protein [Ramlibacter tataouinensis]|uniref:Rhs protein-like protein n=1 Tax=Ramlibacter tataouinensis (strain ATCC BAA-407 / DSM 14655 / LMG 21543 / TTB310) TaxID=365046 RepID=F5Y2J0_RAMTT|nr:Ig-like domain repeat protein [Ramlibacter tataouinensis]AEG92353.1 Rhs protein-like protein [Ramlibacter tataouinensis TTB310]